MNNLIFSINPDVLSITGFRYDGLPNPAAFAVGGGGQMLISCAEMAVTASSLDIGI